MAKGTLNNWKTRHKSTAFWLSVGFGSGLLRPAPGTWGSFAGLLIAYTILQVSYGAYILSLITIIALIAGTFAIDYIEKTTGVHDAPEIVIDEFVGQWIVLIPLLVIESSLLIYALAFVLFRIFDILKPWPISWLDQKVTGGFGVMIDDVVAGIFAALLLFLIGTYLL